jgi:hypothetical protein
MESTQSTILLDDMSDAEAAQLAAELHEGGDTEAALEILRARGELSFVADDGNNEVEYDYFATAREAAEAYVSEGSWGEDESTWWCEVYVFSRWTLDGFSLDEDDRESFSIRVDPPEPECEEECDHEWTSPESLGGCRENPGVWGHGGGVIIEEVCAHCGLHRHTDTWAQCPQTGRQGLTSVRYSRDDTDDTDNDTDTEEEAC